MKREVPIAQFFFPLEAPCVHMQENRKALTLNPSPCAAPHNPAQNAELCNEIHFQLACLWCRVIRPPNL